MNNYSINRNANTLLQKFLKEEERLDVKITKGPLNSKIIDGALVGGASLDVDKFIKIIESVDL